MNGGSILIQHLVELVNAANSLIGKDQRAALEHHLAGDRILHDRSGEAHAGRAAAGRVLTAQRQAIDVVEQLRLGHARISHQANVNVASDLHAARVLVHAAHEHEQQRLLDVLVSVDLRRNALRQLGVEVVLADARRLLLGQLLGEHLLVLGLVEARYAMRLHVGVREQALLDLPEALLEHGQEDARDGHVVAWLAEPRVLALGVYIQATGYIAYRHLFRVLLDLDLLELDKLGATCLQAQSSAGLVHLEMRDHIIMWLQKRRLKCQKIHLK